MLAESQVQCVCSGMEMFKSYDSAGCVTHFNSVWIFVLSGVETGVRNKQTVRLYNAEAEADLSQVQTN